MLEMTVELVLTVLLLMVGVIGASLIIRSARRTLSKSRDGVPPRLPGVWPSYTQKRYTQLSEDAKRAWWKHYWFVRNYLMMPLVAGIIVAFFFQYTFAMLSFTVLLALAFFYSLSGGSEN